ncbi:MAG: hypothetical protein ACR2QC_00875 [Gammaproteobacteria bacterium]
MFYWTAPPAFGGNNQLRHRHFTPDGTECATFFHFFFAEGDSGFRRNGGEGRRRRKRADSPRKSARPHSPIPAKAGISAAAKRRVIVRLYAFGDSLRLSAQRFLPSQEWDVSFRPEIARIAPEQDENGVFSVNRGGET